MPASNWVRRTLKQLPFAYPPISILNVGGFMIGKLSGWLQPLLIVAFMAIGFTHPAAAEPPALSVYGNLPAFETAAISPSGDHVAIVGVAGDKRKLVVLDKEQAVVLKSDVGNMKVWDLYWAGDDAVLVRVSQTAHLGMEFTASKGELHTILVVPLDGSKPWAVFENRSDIQGGIRGVYGLNERNGEWFGYFSGMMIERPSKGDPYFITSNPALFEVNLKTQKTTRIADRSEEFWRTWVVGAEGKVAATLDYDSRLGEWRIKNQKKDVVASGTNPLGGIDLESLGHDGTSVIYARTDENTGESLVYEAPIGGGEPKVLPEVENRALIADKTTRQYIGSWALGDAPSYSFLDAYQQKVIQAATRAFPGSRVELMDWNAKFDRLIVRTDGPNDPVTWWLVNIKTGDAKDLGVSYPMRAADVGPMRMISYNASDGLTIHAVLTLPPGREPKNLPVVVLPHGGPTARDYPGFDWWAQAFASRGYAVLQPNFRGSSGYGAAFENAGHGEWGRKMQTDISEGLAFLARSGVADPKRACIMGGSYGGYAALAGVTLQQGLYRCAVSFAGVADLQMYYNDRMRVTDSNRTTFRAFQKEIGAGRNLQEVSPVRFAERADAPILLIHGKDDTVVYYRQSDAMADALRRANKPFEFVSLPGGDHWLTTSETRLAMLQAAMTFIEKYNPPDPAK